MEIFDRNREFRAKTIFFRIFMEPKHIFYEINNHFRFLIVCMSSRSIEKKFCWVTILTNQIRLMILMNLRENQIL